MKAIHDAHFATPPDSWPEYMARLQYLAEMKVGSAIRRAHQAEDGQFAKAVAAARVN